MRTLEMAVINCEANLILTWSWTCGITNSTGAGRFEIINAKLDIAVVTLSTLIMQNYFNNQNHITSKNICTKPIFKSLSSFKFSSCK